MPTEMEAAVSAALLAGDLLKSRFRTALETREKSPANLVTELDIQSEKLIMASLASAFPDIPMLTEESHPDWQGNPYERWIIDPLDGTTNFAHGYPFFAVSIALERDGQVVLGVVYAPMFGQLFSAQQGGGAFLNNERIHVSGTQVLNKALVASGFPYDAWSNEDNNSRQWSRLLKKVVSLRCDGAAALDLCYVAAGFLDAYWELDLEPWDMAAGVIIAKEAGAKVTLVDGKDFSLFNRNVAASNSLLHEELLSELNHPPDAR
jgi:myo-inositol-1(or 4)-monophosphatase